MPSRPQLSALPSALLLAATGGLLDAVVYLNHGHVFANAMTGNVIFLGIALAAHDWPQILPPSSPFSSESPPTPAILNSPSAAPFR